MYSDYKKSFHLYMSEKQDSAKVTDSKSLAETKEAEDKLAREEAEKLVQDKVAADEKLAQEKAAAEAKMKKELKNNVAKKEREWTLMLSKYNVAKQAAADMVKFAEGLSKEQVVEEVQKHVYLQVLDANEVKVKLLDRLEKAHEAGAEFANAIEAGEDFGRAKDKIKFDAAQEEESVQKMVTLLSIMVRAKRRNNLPGAIDGSTTKHSPFKVKISPVKFSGNPRDFASFKQELVEVVVPNRPVDQSQII